MIGKAMHSPPNNYRAIVFLIVVAVMACPNAAAQIQSPPPIVDHYAGATLLIAPVATPVTPPVAVTSESEYLSIYGQQPIGADDPGRMAARLFFNHGGGQLYVASPPTSDPAGFEAALAGSCDLDVDLVVAAGVQCCTDSSSDHAALMNALSAHAASTRQRFALISPPQGSDAASLLALRANLDDTRAAALHAPWLVVPDPNAIEPASTIEPSAAVAGIISRIDRTQGLHVAPAGPRAEILADSLESDLSGDADALNVEGINAIRAFTNPDGLFVWGARTMSTSNEFRFIAPTRLHRHMEHSATESLQWIREEEATDVNLAEVQNRLETWLFGYWQSGSFQGTSPDEGYFHNCSADLISLRCVIGIAPVRPAEFMVFVVDVAFREVLFRSDFADADCG